MLFINRVVNESLIIGTDIEVKVAYIKDGSVCLGVDAPREIAVSRKEALKKIKAIVKKSKLEDHK